MADQRENALQYALNNREIFLSKYKEILAIPSVSTEKAHRPDIQRAAEWLSTQLQTLGDAEGAAFPNRRVADRLW